MGFEEEDVAGRCAAILANGKRCPNAALTGSRYCPVPTHQALQNQDSDHLVPPGSDGAGEDAEPVEEPAGEPVAVSAEGAEAGADPAGNVDSPVDDPVGGAPDEPATPEAAEPAVPEEVVGGAPAEPAEPVAAGDEAQDVEDVGETAPDEEDPGS